MAARTMTSPPTAPIVAAGLVGGYLSARLTGVRPLGGVVLGAAGVVAGRAWVAAKGPGTAAALVGVYLGAFGISHPLAKKIGAWPAVAVVTTAASVTTALVADR